MGYIRRKIYYDKQTGIPIVTTPEMINPWITETTVEQDIATYRELSERNRDSFDVIQLEYGQYAQDFAECDAFRVNPETKQLEFSYPDPNVTEQQEPVYQRPLSEELEETKQAIAELTLLIAGGM
ncbi:hypothetical protein ABE218_08395 [Bacillus smithii]|jgi:hypothetical protein|uniref:hypothetical protein n=1 Tax=Bacillus smithii TaxID=1479 RepID=UPI003D22C213